MGRIWDARIPWPELKRIYKDYYEAAKIDGANAVHQFYNITLPLIMPSINIVLTFSIISGLKVFPQVYALTDGGPAGATQVIGTYLYKTFADGYLGYSSAVGICFYRYGHDYHLRMSLLFKKKRGGDVGCC